ncbi:MAG: hypothetical protein ACLFO2_00975 [Candidatus Woesearchaeota archaeon]
MALIEYYPQGMLPQAILYEQTTRKGIILQEEGNQRYTVLLHSDQDWLPEFYPRDQEHHAETAPFHSHVMSDQHWKTLQTYAQEQDHEKVFAAVKNLEARLDNTPMHVYKRQQPGSERTKEKF